MAWGDSATLDHVVPRARGGSSYALLNIVHCCWLCNQRKAAQDHDEFLDALLGSNGRIILSSGASLAEWESWAVFVREPVIVLLLVAAQVWVAFTIRKDYRQQLVRSQGPRHTHK